MNAFTHSKLCATAAATCLAAAATSANAQMIFRDGFEFLPGNEDYLVVWEHDPDLNQFFDIRGRGLGNDTFNARLNPDASGQQLAPALAIAANGDFVVVWQDDRDNNGAYQIYARGFHADGSERIPRFTVNTVGAGQQLNPDIAMAPNGDFVVVWEDDNDGNGFFEVLGRGFNANGSEKFDDFKLNNFPGGDQILPVIAMADDGGFVAAWADDQDNDKIFEISARLFSANGNPRFGQFQVNPVSAGLQFEPAVAMSGDGRFAVAWRDDRDLNFFGQIRANAYDQDGTSVFEDLTLNAVGRANQYYPALAMADDGSFVATWVDQGQQIMGRVFDPDGTPRMEDLILNQDRFRLTSKPSAAVLASGAFMLVWQELDQGGNWNIKGAPMSPQGSASTVVSIASSTGDQQLPAVASR